MRFSIPPRMPVGEQVLSKATRLRVDLMRGTEGEIVGDFVIEGVVANEGADPRDYLAFIGQLLADFTDPREGEGGGV